MTDSLHAAVPHDSMRCVVDIDACMADGPHGNASVAGGRDGRVTQALPRGSTMPRADDRLGQRRSARCLG